MSVVRMSPLGSREGEFALITSSRARRSWMAITNNRYDDESVVAAYGFNNLILPRPYLDRHPTLPLMLCRNLRLAQQDREPLKWICVADYTSEPLRLQEMLAQQLPPLQRPAKIRWKKVGNMVYQNRDINGRAFVNSAGEPIDPPPQIRRSQWLMNVTKNVEGLPISLLSSGDFINSVPWEPIPGLVIPKYCARLDDLDLSDLQTEYDANNTVWTYYTFNFSVMLDLVFGFRIKEIDRGYNYFSIGKLYPIYEDDNITPVKSPRCLDGLGNVLSASADPVFLTFDGYSLADFSSLPTA